MRTGFLTAAFLVVTLAFATAQPAPAPLPFIDLSNKPPAFTITSDFSSKALKPGSVMVGSIYITAPHGWHIYAPGVEKYIPLEVAPGEGPLTGVQFSYPPSEVLNLLGEKVPVYGGRVEIVAQGIVSLSAKAGEFVWRPVVSWQGCTDSICLAPQTKTLEIPVTVAKDK